MATREGEYPFATIIALDGNVVADDAVRDASRKPNSEKRLAAPIVRRVATRDRSERKRRIPESTAPNPGWNGGWGHRVAN
jgi:hypothetical protein